MTWYLIHLTCTSWMPLCAWCSHDTGSSAAGQSEGNSQLGAMLLAAEARNKSQATLVEQLQSQVGAPGAVHVVCAENKGARGSFAFPPPNPLHFAQVNALQKQLMKAMKEAAKPPT